MSGLVGGGVASLSTQVVMVPIDVVSQRYGGFGLRIKLCIHVINISI